MTLFIRFLRLKKQICVPLELKKIKHKTLIYNEFIRKN